MNLKLEHHRIIPIINDWKALLVACLLRQFVEKCATSAASLKLFREILIRQHINPSHHSYHDYITRSNRDWLRGFLSKLHGAAPIAALRHMLDAVDNELEHIRKHMQDHSIPHSTGQLNVLKETIAPSSSVSVQAAMRYLRA
jgi:hypothetical protein